MKIYAGDYDDIPDAAIIVVTAGANQKPGETRLDLVRKNAAIFKSIMPEISKRKYLLSEHLSVDSRSIHAYIIGEHGDSEFAAWSSANVSGVPLYDFCKMRGHANFEEATRNIESEVRNSAYEIIRRKHATYYGIAMSVKRICEAIIRDEKSVLAISSVMDDVYGVEDVALSMSAIVGKDDVEDLIPVRLSVDEQIAARGKILQQRNASGVHKIYNAYSEYPYE